MGIESFVVFSLRNMNCHLLINRYFILGVSWHSVNIAELKVRRFTFKMGSNANIRRGQQLDPKMIVFIMLLSYNFA